MHIYTCIHTHMYTCMHTKKLVGLVTQFIGQVYMYIYTHICTYIHVYTHICTRACILRSSWAC